MENNYQGKIIGNYLILEKTSQKDKSGHSIFVGKCIHCGNIQSFSLRSISYSGKRCSHFDRFGSPTYLCENSSDKRIIKIFNQMKTRCYDKNSKDYRWYGGKGVNICEDWLNDPRSFVNWAINNGYKIGLTIDRIDSSKGYNPENCRWISLEDNSRRAGKVNFITINGETLTGKQWSKRINKGVNFVNRYIRLYGEEFAISTIKSILQGEFV